MLRVWKTIDLLYIYIVAVTDCDNNLDALALTTDHSHVWSDADEKRRLFRN